MASRALKARNQLGVACRHHPEQETEARRNLAEAKISDYVEKVLAEAPPLTDQQRETICALLRTGARKGVALLADGGDTDAA
jgi:hypothetical protein